MIVMSAIRFVNALLGCRLWLWVIVIGSQSQQQQPKAKSKEDEKKRGERGGVTTKGAVLIKRYNGGIEGRAEHQKIPYMQESRLFL